MADYFKDNPDAFDFKEGIKPGDKVYKVDAFTDQFGGFSMSCRRFWYIPT